MVDGHAEEDASLCQTDNPSPLPTTTGLNDRSSSVSEQPDTLADDGPHAVIDPSSSSSRTPKTFTTNIKLKPVLQEALEDLEDAEDGLVVEASLAEHRRPSPPLSSQPSTPGSVHVANVTALRKEQATPLDKHSHARRATHSKRTTRSATSLEPQRQQSATSSPTSHADTRTLHSSVLGATTTRKCEKNRHSTAVPTVEAVNGTPDSAPALSTRSRRSQPRPHAVSKPSTESKKATLTRGSRTQASPQPEPLPWESVPARKPVSPHKESLLQPVTPERRPSQARLSTSADAKYKAGSLCGDLDTLDDPTLIEDITNGGEDKSEAPAGLTQKVATMLAKTRDSHKVPTLPMLNDEYFVNLHEPPHNQQQEPRNFFDDANGTSEVLVKTSTPLLKPRTALVQPKLSATNTDGGFSILGATSRVPRPVRRRISDTTLPFVAKRPRMSLDDPSLRSYRAKGSRSEVHGNLRRINGREHSRNKHARFADSDSDSSIHSDNSGSGQPTIAALLREAGELMTDMLQHKIDAPSREVQRLRRSLELSVQATIQKWTDETQCHLRDIKTGYESRRIAIKGVSDALPVIVASSTKRHAKLVEIVKQQAVSPMPEKLYF